ncbi:MAG TPA: tRNA pseudouridine(38-40) synthase TruA [Bacilli bacterium]|nr:tRNA pseudouridine(38-40) synthase TruA [Bacilli bacterium]
MRVLGIVAYDGTNYNGWQRQPDEPSIQGEIERVLSQILDTHIEVYGSGRTDRGVHAKGQTFHFDIDKPFDLNKLLIGFNSLVNKDIRLLKLKRIKHDFHARYNAKGKVYYYLINNGEYSPFDRQYCMQIRAQLDIAAMTNATRLFIGTHNFQDFTTKDEDKEGYVRTINDISIKTKGKLIRIDINGSGFMTYMIRFIVGTLIAIGNGKENELFIKRHLDSASRDVISYKAEPQGLYLYRVIY